MVELEMRGLGLFGAVLLLSTGTLGQVQRPRYACAENAIVVPCTAGSHAQQTTSAEGNRGCTICRDDLRLISFPLSHELNQNVTAQADGMVVPPNLRSLYVEGSTRPGLLDAVKKAHSKLFQMAFSAVPGQVEKPGPYPLGYDPAVVQAIAVTGGLAPRAEAKSSFTVRFRRIVLKFRNARSKISFTEEI